MPVQIEMRLVRLAFGFEQRRRVLEKRHADLMRAGSHRETSLQIRVNDVIVLVPLGRRHREQLHALAIQQQLQFVRLMQALDFLVPIPRQSDLDFVLAVLRKGIGNQCAAAGADRKPFHALLLSEVRPNAKGVAAWRTAGRSNCEPADFLRRGNIAVEECRREIADRHIVKATTGVVFRQQF